MTPVDSSGRNVAPVHPFVELFVLQLADFSGEAAGALLKRLER
jgi:hypothetical protein